MARSTDNPWLHRFAVATAAATLLLICVGGLVTSHGVGMSVPDWPTTYGYNMFLFPFSKWIGGIFYEHSHRLLASAVGFLTIILAVWLWIKEERRWLRWLGIAALLGVIAQGVLGGLRVTWMKDELGIFHAAFAQICFVLVCAIALFCSRWWSSVSSSGLPQGIVSSLQKLSLAATILIFIQLVLGATMRHQHAGLSIPDFPLAYGRVWPSTDADSIARYNQLRMETKALNPITSTQVLLQMTHRIGALIILCVISAVTWFGFRRLRENARLFQLSIGWSALVWCQALLGAATIWTDKSADIATAHVAVGALSLLNGVLLILITSRYVWKTPAAEPKVAAAVSYGAARKEQVGVAA
jgi:heme a synthase